MATKLQELLAGAKRIPGQGFELDLEPSHLSSTLPPELKIFEKNFKFTPVRHDPFPKPKKAPR